MADKTHIEWADRTWNVVTGCTRVSPGCDHCYIAGTPPFRMAGRKFDGEGPGSSIPLVFHPERLTQPLRVRKPQRWFVNSLADLFHEDVPDDFIAKVFAIMAAAPTHTFQVLTKRHARMRSWLSGPAEQQVRDVLAGWERVGIWMNDQHSAAWLCPEGLSERIAWPLPNVWLGVSVEDQKWADIRIPALLDTPAAVRFLSCEPLLGPVDLAQALRRWEPPEDHDRWTVNDLDVGHRGTHRLMADDVLHWVIVGGESGPGARPMHPDWARGIRDQCEAAGIPFLFKQWGAHVVEDQSPLDIVLPHTSWRLLGERGPSFYRVGKKAAGRELDGRTWDQYPEPVTQ